MTVSSEVNLSHFLLLVLQVYGSSLSWAILPCTWNYGAMSSVPFHSQNYSYLDDKLCSDFHQELHAL